MIKMMLAAAVAFVSLPAGAVQAPSSSQIINLSCVEALVSVDEQRLAGIFSFVSEKDGPAAFADLIVHNKKELKKFVAKVQKDKKLANGISAWDRDALQFALGIYGSPVGPSLEPVDEKFKTEIQALAAGPVLTLEQISAARRKP